MTEHSSDPPRAAQSLDPVADACTCAAIQKQWRCDRRWFEAYPWRGYRARRMTSADCAEIRARGYRLNNIPSDRAYAILILRVSADFHMFRPASVTLEAAKWLDRMNDAEIHAWESDRGYSFFRPVLACPPGNATFGFTRNYKDADSPPHWTVPCEARPRAERPDPFPDTICVPEAPYDEPV